MKPLIGLFVALISWSLPAPAQEMEKNEVGLVIGGIITPSLGLSPGTSLIGPGATAIPTRDIKYDASLTLGAEYDRGSLVKQRIGVYGGIDFLASPLDVKLSQPSQNSIGQYAFVFLTPRIKVKFHPTGAFSP